MPLLVAYLILVCLALLHRFYLYTTAKLTPAALDADLPALTALRTSLPASSMHHYYTRSWTCYTLLQHATHSGGMHSSLDLGPGLPRRGIQPTLVLEKIVAARAKRVLELGCGRGFCTAYLRALLPDVEFFAIDAVPEHIAYAKRNIPGATFRVLDALELPSLSLKFDLVFAVESLCHLGSVDKVRALGNVVRRCLRPQGALVVIDGFRAGRFAEAPRAQQEAMRCAERAFQIERMLSPLEWEAAMQKEGMVLMSKRDLTREVLPFWEKAWRACRVVAWACARWPWRRGSFAWVANVLAGDGRELDAARGSQMCWVANVLAGGAVAHALRDKGAAEYACLEFWSWD